MASVYLISKWLVHLGVDEQIAVGTPAESSVLQLSFRAIKNTSARRGCAETKTIKSACRQVLPCMRLFYIGTRLCVRHSCTYRTARISSSGKVLDDDGQLGVDVIGFGDKAAISKPVPGTSPQSKSSVCAQYCVFEWQDSTRSPSSSSSGG